MVENKCISCNRSMHFKFSWDATQENDKQFQAFLFQCPECKDIAVTFPDKETEPNS